MLRNICNGPVYQSPSGSGPLRQHRNHFVHLPIPADDLILMLPIFTLINLSIWYILNRQEPTSSLLVQHHIPVISGISLCATRQVHRNGIGSNPHKHPKLMPYYTVMNITVLILCVCGYIIIEISVLCGLTSISIFFSSLSAAIIAAYHSDSIYGLFSPCSTFGGFSIQIEFSRLLAVMWQWNGNSHHLSNWLLASVKAQMTQWLFHMCDTQWFSQQIK